MVLSFLYFAFVRILELFRRSRRDSQELAIEIVMLRHEVAVLVVKWPDRLFGPRIERCLLG